MRIVLLTIGCLVWAQEKPVTFEVASLRPAAPLNDARQSGIRGGPRTADPGRITIRAMTLRTLLREAYGLQFYQVSAPAWADDERYDVVANVPAGATREESMTMLQNLLADRLKVKARVEKREMPVYALRVGKNGHKLVPSEGEVDEDGIADYFRTARVMGKDGFPVTAGVLRSGIVFSFGPEGGKVAVVRQRLARFAALLSNRLDRPVVDETGLKGLYSFDVYFVPPHGAQYGPEDDVGQGVSIFSAIPQQLGLQLTATKGMVPFLVVESAERVPAAN